MKNVCVKKKYSSTSLFLSSLLRQELTYIYIYIYIHTIARIYCSLFWRLTNALVVVSMLTTREHGHTKPHWRRSTVDLQRLAERAGDSSFIGLLTPSQCNRHCCYTAVNTVSQTPLYHYIILPSAFFTASTVTTYHNENSNKFQIFFLSPSPHTRRQAHIHYFCAQ